MRWSWSRPEIATSAGSYYAARSPQLLRDFDEATRKVRQLFIATYGTDADAVIADARTEFTALIPALPEIEAKPPRDQFHVATAWLLAFYRAVQRRGMPVEEAGCFLYDATELFVATYPRFITRMIGGNLFSRRYLRKLRERAARSQLRHFPGDYVVEYVPGDGTFDFGVDYRECASVKFLRAQGAPELAQHICPVDIIYSDTFGWGLRRTTTLAMGGDHCDFRFTKGGPTVIAVPESLRAHLAERRG